MAEKADPNGDVRRYQNIRENIKNSETLHEVDRQPILDFGEYRFNRVEPSTAGNSLFHTGQAAECTAAVDLPPLVEWDLSDFETFNASLKREELPNDVTKEGTKRNIRQALRKFFEWLDRDWHEEIPVGKPPNGKIRREDLLTQDEISALFAEASNPRDECLLALPLATFQRQGALRSLRVRDIHLSHENQTGWISLVGEDAYGQKDADGKRPLSWATAYAERWKDKHPRRDDPDAPFLCVITNAGKAEKGTRLSKTSYVNALRRLAKRAGLDRDRYVSSEGRKERTLGPHLLRHTGITRAVLNPEFSDQIIKQWAGWTEDSQQLRNYINLTDDDVLDAVNRAYGFDDPESTDLAFRPDPGSCPRCGTATEGWMNACPQCTMLLTTEAGAVFEVADEAREEATERAVESTDETEVEALNAIREDADDPLDLYEQLDELRARIAELEGS